jgi:hypothetical protein
VLDGEVDPVVAFVALDAFQALDEEPFLTALIEEPGQFGVLAEALAQALPHLSLSALGHVPTLRLGQSGGLSSRPHGKPPSGRKEP